MAYLVATGCHRRASRARPAQRRWVMQFICFSSVSDPVFFRIKLRGGDALFCQGFYRERKAGPGPTDGNRRGLNSSRELFQTVESF